jgi:acyl-CoA thioesterase I
MNRLDFGGTRILNGTMNKPEIIKPDDLILFQGDSITDCGRRDSEDGLGTGYAAIIRGLLSRNTGLMPLKILNRGIGGDRTVELLQRWKEDCEDLKPDVLSITIGVNDVWRIMGEWEGQTYVGPEAFSENYRRLIDRALAAGVRRLILCSPTAIENHKDSRIAALIEERAEIVKNMAAEYKAVYVPFLECQLELLKTRPEVMWTIDGCHPTTAGHAALARCWLETLGLLP